MSSEETLGLAQFPYCSNVSLKKGQQTKNLFPMMETRTQFLRSLTFIQTNTTSLGLSISTNRRRIMMSKTSRQKSRTIIMSIWT